MRRYGEAVGWYQWQLPQRQNVTLYVVPSRYLITSSPKAEWCPPSYNYGILNLIATTHAILRIKSLFLRREPGQALGFIPTFEPPHSCGTAIRPGRGHAFPCLTAGGSLGLFVFVSRGQTDGSQRGVRNRGWGIVFGNSKIHGALLISPSHEKMPSSRDLSPFPLRLYVPVSLAQAGVTSRLAPSSDILLRQHLLVSTLSAPFNFYCIVFISDFILFLRTHPLSLARAPSLSLAPRQTHFSRQTLFRLTYEAWGVGNPTDEELERHVEP